MGRPPIHDGCYTVEYLDARIERLERKIRRNRETDWENAPTVRVQAGQRPPTRKLTDRERDSLQRDLAKLRDDRAALPEAKIHTVYIRKTKPDRWVPVGQMCLACRVIDDYLL